MLKPLLILHAILALPLAAQANPELVTRCDPPAGSLGRMTSSQKAAFMQSQDKLLASHPAEAVADLRDLLGQLKPNSPASTVIAERLAEASLEAGDRPAAIALLQPIEQRDPGDCLAHTLLARAAAEDNRAADRDAEVKVLAAMHKEHRNSAAGKLDLFLLEQHALGNGGIVRIWHVLQPYGPHHTYLASEVLGPNGNLVMRLELDSDDPDQVYFRSTHPELAANGDRRYSLDGFAPPEVRPNGTAADTHALIQFYEGAPAYDTVRDRILAIAKRGADLPAKP